ncbi:transcriptional regulator, XRE family [Rippkaea orientalis PCC 8801]|uniref:Transcriptional regulator, XRE family n=1 Tax=Rippkaea orientalis (strain PCC 8801 / RF-1) TaxID=41431 RepID=B7K3G7_RIPO1|nr:nucleoside 2-deoxyribosyltransferase [Rippkaea orientalis]ACK65309.1 transcriptional regulator, XRE family [Rippkaea orientalis PCC 8801]
MPSMLEVKIYVSGALTGIENAETIKAFYEAIGSLCNELGFQSYVPHLNTDPITHPNVTPEQVYETDKHQVSQADLVIAYLGFPSFGVGMELAFAVMQNIPVILLYENTKIVSRFPRGIPTKIAEIQFKDYDDAIIQLREILIKLPLVPLTDNNEVLKRNKTQ